MRGLLGLSGSFPNIAKNSIQIFVETGWKEINGLVPQYKPNAQKVGNTLRFHVMGEKDQGDALFIQLACIVLQ